MATNANGLRKTSEVLEAIEQSLKAMKIAGPGGPTQEAFQSVGIFDVADLSEALRNFIATKDRVAFVIFAGDTYENDIKGTDAVSLQTRYITIMIADRVIGTDRRKPLFGDGEHVGAMALVDEVVIQLSGILLPNPKGIYMRPTGIEPLVIRDAEKKEMPGRAGMLVHFEARGGELRKDLKGPIK